MICFFYLNFFYGFLFNFKVYLLIYCYVKKNYILLLFSNVIKEKNFNKL